MKELQRKMRKSIECGDIYWTKIPKSTGHEYSKLRPYLVIDTNQCIYFGGMACMVPLTTKLSKRSCYDVLIQRDNNNKLKSDSLAKLDHIYTFDQCRLKIYLGSVDVIIMRQIHFNLRKRFNL